ncbi:kelch-like protein 10 [Zootermopsis nevadensis]|uniref:Kelch-like protein diablo n=1 Tax=Zootermopsis nevadensis TaxID=136037 RepID=A0A067QXJ8_ZOONE|nr:kelch-like protein 10 [Zootermopsis nevadensis]KDR15171.1 Kelch-like protein 10 [Zootermopsis nevadensis]
MEPNQSSQDGGRLTRTEALVPLNELREKNLLCDAVLRLDDGGVFRVHRVILSMSSEYFRNLFTTTLHTIEETDILLHGVSSDMMIQILDFVYVGKVDIRSDNVRQLLVAAEYLCILDLNKLCCDFLKDATDVDNCIDIMHFARFHLCADLETEARRFLLYHFVEVSQQSKELLELPVEELQAIIESDELVVEDEKVVWECILRWINHDPDNRKGHIADLLKGVRLGLLDAEFFLETVSNHPYVKDNDGCRPLISETLAFRRYPEMMTKEGKEFVTPRIARPRIPQDILFAIGGRCDGRPTDLIEAYDARADGWSVVEGVDSICPRANHGTAVVGFDIYIIGGINHSSEGLSSCQCFNAVTKTCREVAPMNVWRRCLSVAVLRGAVYAMGGLDGRLRLKTAETYDCKTNQWSWIAPMNRERRSASAAVLNDNIYVAGGVTGVHRYGNSVEVYDPDTNKWTFVAPMLSRRASFSCVAFHGCLYALGGQNRTSGQLTTEKYDPAEDTWTEMPAMNFYSTDLHAEVINDMIYVIGRYYESHIFVVNCYNDKEDKWYKVTNMNVCRFFASTCVIKNLPNASDYAYKHRDNLMKRLCAKYRNSEIVRILILIVIAAFGFILYRLTENF